MTQPFSQAVQNVYGYDLQCTSDLTQDAAEVGGVAVVANALYRRAITPRGSLIYDQNYGYDLGGWINADVNVASDIAPIGAGLDAEFLKDPRVYASTTVVTWQTGGNNLGQLTTTTQVTLAAGPTFQLVLGVSAVSGNVQILNVSPT